MIPPVIFIKEILMAILMVLIEQVENRVAAWQRHLRWLYYRFLVVTTHYSLHCFAFLVLFKSLDEGGLRLIFRDTRAYSSTLANTSHLTFSVKSAHEFVQTILLCIIDAFVLELILPISLLLLLLSWFDCRAIKGYRRLPTMILCAAFSFSHKIL